MTEETEKTKIDIENLNLRVIKGIELLALSKLAKESLARTKMRVLNNRIKDPEDDQNINFKKPTQKDWMKIIYDDMTEEFNMDKLEYGPNTLKFIKIISIITEISVEDIKTFDFVDIIGLVFKIFDAQKVGVERSFLKNWITNLLPSTNVSNS